jgi:hypothetical protein
MLANLSGDSRLWRKTRSDGRRKAFTLYTVAPVEDGPAPGLVASIGGFSLHAGTICEPWQRSRLERLCRYITRPAIATKRVPWRIATKRLSVDTQGRVVYRKRETGFMRRALERRSQTAERKYKPPF